MNHSSVATEKTIIMKLNAKLIFLIVFVYSSTCGVKCFREVGLLDELDP